MKTRPNKMISYLAVTAGVGCVSSAANAALTVTIYNEPGVTALDFGSVDVVFFPYRAAYVTQGYTDPYTRNYIRGVSVPPRQAFSGIGIRGGVAFDAVGRATNQGAFAGRQSISPQLMFDGAALNGALLNSADNFLGWDRNSDGVAESVLKLGLDSQGRPRILAWVQTTDAGGLTAFAASNAINAIPEPSGLVLLALGATGLAARRQRRKAA